MVRARVIVGARGLSLLEVVVVMGVIASFVAFLGPTVAGMVAGDNERKTQQQVEQVWRAIYGEPANGNFGYLGDMGRLPTTLTELVEQGQGQGTQLAWHTSDAGVEHVGRVGTGWRGPYLKDFFGTTDLLSDAWGRPLTFSNGQITSSGPDGQLSTTGDNIVFPAHAPPTSGTVFVSVLANRIPDPLGATATLYTTVNGEQVAGTTKKNLASDSTFDGFFFESVPPGILAMKVAQTAAIADTNPVQCVTVSRIVPITVHAGAQVVRDIRMITSADVKVTDNPCTIPD
jgi:type II secretory pathway pseudopilin PulG